jgi:hypothetical protein
MARIGTSLLNLGTWPDAENPGAGSQSVDSTGLNGNFIKLDTAVGSHHNADGTHKANIIDKASLKTTVADASTIELDGTNGLQVKDAGITAAKLATDAVETLKIKAANVTAVKLATDSVEEAKIKAAAVTTTKIKDANVTSAKLAYKEYQAMLTQVGTGVPSLSVNVNTLGATPTAGRSGVGVYSINCAGMFVGNVGFLVSSSQAKAGYIKTDFTDPDYLTIETFDNSNAASDGVIGYAYVYIRIEP